MSFTVMAKEWQICHSPCASGIVRDAQSAISDDRLKVTGSSLNSSFILSNQPGPPQWQLRGVEFSW